MSRLSKRSRARGFTLIEVMVSIFILSIGIISVAALATTMLATGKRSKYMALASSLASEKLEDLSRYPSDNPQVCVPTGNTTAGSLTTDSAPATVTCPSGSSNSVSYDDDVSINLGNATGDCPNAGGCFSETVSSVGSSGTQYVTTYHSPDGRITTSAPTTTVPGNMTFHRRWYIEANTPVSGVRRVTVLVTLSNNTVQPAVKFQMTSVRP